MNKVSPKTIQRLKKAAARAVKYRDKFEAFLESAKQAQNWEEVAQKEGMMPNAEAQEWMC